MSVSCTSLFHGGFRVGYFLFIVPHMCIYLIVLLVFAHKYICLLNKKLITLYNHIFSIENYAYKAHKTDQSITFSIRAFFNPMVGGRKVLWGGGSLKSFYFFFLNLLK